jgi:pimeloyl-ACP methyl ester carboxylesterase
MLHGFSNHAASWRRLAEALPERRVLALDQRGHGDTEWATVYGSRRMVADVEAFTEAMGLGRFDLLGLSMGGINALGFTGANPGRVDRLVVIDIGPEIAPEGLSRIMTAVRQADVFASEEEAFAQARAGNPIPRDEVLRERVVAGLKPTEGGFTFKFDKALRDGSAEQDAYTADELWKLWEAVDAPTLLVRGELSDILAPDVAEQMVARLPGSRLVTIPGSGHTVPLDQPELLAHTVREFLG